MQVIPVLDLLNGIVVRGVGGRRDEYQPLTSRLVERPEALSVARAFRDKIGLTRLYLADLDAIVHQRPNFDIYRRLAADGFTLMIDAGLRNVDAARPVFQAGTAQVIAGLETWPGPCELAQLCAAVGTERVIFSLDIKGGVPLGDTSGWPSSDPLRIGATAIEAGISELIVLDLASVGESSGVPTSELCGQLRERYPQLRLITGGGVRDARDIDRLAQLGIDGVLVASALHEGTITRRSLYCFGGGRAQDAPRSA